MVLRVDFALILDEAPEVVVIDDAERISPLATALTMALLMA
ncbi:hypothetical protein [Candidatus Amarobacter glycogenicus]